MRFTLDTNCIIDLERRANDFAPLTTLVQAHAAGKIVVAVPGVAASEKRQDGSYESIFTPFQSRVQALGLSNAEVLKPHAYLGIGFLDQMVLAGDATIDLERRIHNVLFPLPEFEWSAWCANRGFNPANTPPHGKWLNAKCDVLSMWCHIHYGGDVFVTRDRNFHKAKKKPVLEDMGAGRIERAVGAAALI